MAFAVGQIVELLELLEWLPALQNGDRSTITGLVPMRVAPVTVRWHRIDREVFMTECTLRIYVPGVSSVNVILALQTVLREEQPHAVTELRRDLAEARGTIAVLRAQATDTSRLYDALVEYGDLLNVRDSVVGSLASGYARAIVAVAHPDTDLRQALDAAAAVMDAAMTELRNPDDEDVDDATDEGTDEGTDEDAPIHHGFLVGDRVRVRMTFAGVTELRGLTGTVIDNGEDLRVRFDNPPDFGGAMFWETVSHAAHNFERIQ